MSEAKTKTIVKKVKNCIQYSDGTFKIENVRASYPHLDAPYAGKDAEDDEDGGKGKKKKGKYGIVGLGLKETHKEAMLLCKAYVEQKNKEAKKTIGKNNWFIRNGDDSGKPENEGNYTWNASEVKRPRVRGRDGRIMEPDEVAEKIYGGCYVNILIKPWIQDNKWGKKHNAGLIAVQFVRDGEPFGEGRVSDDDVFEELDDEDFDAADLDYGDDDDL